MFTGIVQAIGRIEKVEPHEGDVRLTISSGALDMSDVVQGDSIAANGVCLTVVEQDVESYQVHVSAETLRCTVGLSAPGEVNLEKALRLADRLGGHMVSGHVTGWVKSRASMLSVIACGSLSVLRTRSRAISRSKVPSP